MYNSKSLLDLQRIQQQLTDGPIDSGIKHLTCLKVCFYIFNCIFVGSNSHVNFKVVYDKAHVLKSSFGWNI